MVQYVIDSPPRRPRPRNPQTFDSPRPRKVHEDLDFSSSPEEPPAIIERRGRRPISHNTHHKVQEDPEEADFQARVHKLQLGRLTVAIERFREELELPRMKMSEVCPMLINATKVVKDHMVPGAITKDDVFEDPYAVPKEDRECSCVIQ
ncbi:Guanine nucleotide-binding protein subunit gamma [Rhizina undulata]